MSDERRTGAISRRQFITIAALAGGGAIIVAGPLRRRLARGGAAPDPTVFVKILPDDTVVVTIPKSEMGQGVRTSLAMLVAEEMDADWDKVHVETAPFGDQYGYQGTASSVSVRERWTQLRQVGASARAVLLAAAVDRLGVPLGELTTERSVVRHARSGRSIAYGALAAALPSIRPPRRVTLKPRAEWRLLGKEQRGKDTAAIVRGTAIYGLDVRVPGMRFATIERPREFGFVLAWFDDAAALAVPGVVKVVAMAGDPRAEVPPGVAVVATNTWAALQGRRAMRIEWKSGPHSLEDTASHRKFMLDAVGKTGEEIVHKVGDPDAILARSTAVIRADYEVPFLAHATMEPMNCTAHVRGGTAELWSPTQFPDGSAQQAARVLGIPLANVTVHVPLIGGGFGRRIRSDYAVEAALLSKEIGAPVQVVWTREDDIQHDFYRPCALHRMEATLDSNGWPAAWRHRMSSAAIAASGGRTPATGAGTAESGGARDAPYRVPNRSSEYTLLPSGVPRGTWRAVHQTHTVFAVESFVDELAAAARRDPLEYRLALIDASARTQDDADFPFDPERLKAVLRLAAEKAGWGRPLPAGHAQGIACAYDQFTYVAEVVEVSVVQAAIRVPRVVVAVDCGAVVNPNGARAQVEGGVTQALSAALKERITIARGGVEQSNFGDYAILPINEAPGAVEAYFVDSDAHPTGLGEPPVPPLAPALANAVARATGRRLRSLPLDLGART